MRGLSLSVALVALLGTATLNAAFSDDFSIGQTTSTNNASAGFDTGSTLLTSYGSRTIQTEILSNSAPGDARGRTAITGGAFSFSSDDGVTGLGYLSFTTPINLTLTPDIQIALLNNDASGTFRIDVSDSSGSVSTISYVLFQIPSGLPPGAFTLNFAANPAGINLASVTKLTFYFGGAASEDLAIDSIQAVAPPAVVNPIPEPGSLSLVALLGGLAGVGLLVRRRSCYAAVCGVES